ncbi:MAG: hypothetical protein LCH39_02230 [Proteobacteria bacterium]|nr:hypothetical protein [Pseudomonadota bacterium]
MGFDDKVHGDEAEIEIHDEEVDSAFEKLKLFISEKKAVLIEKIGPIIVGSQEINYYKFLIDNNEVRIIFETYFGIRIIGKRCILDEINLIISL